MNCLYILNIDTSLVSTFFHSVGHSATLLTVSFAMQNLSSLSNSPLFTSAFILLPRNTDLRKYSYWQCPRMLPMLSCRIFVVSCFICRSLNHFVHIFVYGVKESSNFIALHIAVQLSHLLKILSFHHCIFLQRLILKTSQRNFS